MIQTVDFFTPVVDDPYWFGQIAAANALSDVYAMGGIPKTAMNLVAFPLKQMDLSILRQILQGGIDKLKEAEVVLIGGHSVEDRELKYGLSVTGFIHPDQVLTKKNLKAGDLLILTKPLGTGIINTAIKGGMASNDLIERVTRLMAMLNRNAAEIMTNYPVHACTDITGFGLLGHLAEMVIHSGMGIRLFSDRIPMLEEAIEFAAMGLVPGGAFENRKFRQSMIDFPATLTPAVQDVLFDPQTSGGLLICVDKTSADKLLDDLNKHALDHSSIIGEVSAEIGEKIVVL